MNIIANSQNFTQTTAAAAASCAAAQLAGREIALLGTLIAAGTTPLAATLLGVAPVISAIFIGRVASLCHVPNSFRTPVAIVLGTAASTAALTLMYPTAQTTILTLAAISITAAQLSKLAANILFRTFIRVFPNLNDDNALIALVALHNVSIFSLATGLLAGYEISYIGALIPSGSVQRFVLGATPSFVIITAGLIADYCHIYFSIEKTPQKGIVTGIGLLSAAALIFTNTTQVSLVATVAMYAFSIGIGIAEAAIYDSF